jgi:hypothetical protein
MSVTCLEVLKEKALLGKGSCGALVNVGAS